VLRVTGFYRLSVDKTRFLSVGAVPLAYVLRIRFLKHNPANPQWLMRDGFVL
jgi:transketolase